MQVKKCTAPSLLTCPACIVVIRGIHTLFWSLTINSSITLGFSKHILNSAQTSLQWTTAMLWFTIKDTGVPWSIFSCQNNHPEDWQSQFQTCISPKQPSRTLVDAQGPMLSLIWGQIQRKFKCIDIPLKLMKLKTGFQFSPTSTTYCSFAKALREVYLVRMPFFSPQNNPVR